MAGSGVLVVLPLAMFTSIVLATSSRNNRDLDPSFDFAQFAKMFGICTAVLLCIVLFDEAVEVATCADDQQGCATNPA